MARPQSLEGTRDSRTNIHVQEWEEFLAAKFPGGLYTHKPLERAEPNHCDLLLCEPSETLLVFRLWEKMGHQGAVQPFWVPVPEGTSRSVFSAAHRAVMKWMREALGLFYLTVPGMVLDAY